MNRISGFFSRIFYSIASRFSGSHRSSETSNIAQKNFFDPSKAQSPPLMGRTHFIETSSLTPRTSSNEINKEDKSLILSELNNPSIELFLENLPILAEMSQEELKTEGLPKKIQDLFLNLNEDALNSSLYRPLIREILIKNPTILNLEITKKLIEHPNYHQALLTAVLSQINKDENSNFLKENYPVISLLTTDHLDSKHPLFGKENEQNLKVIQELKEEKPDSKKYHTKLISFYIKQLESPK